MSDAQAPEPGSKVRRAVQWLQVFLLGVLLVVLLASVTIVVQGLLLISTSVVGGLATVLAGLMFSFGVLWRIKVKWAQLRGSDRPDRA
jgi:hypothetical protein